MSEYLISRVTRIKMIMMNKNESIRWCNAMGNERIKCYGNKNIELGRPGGVRIRGGKE